MAHRDYNIDVYDAKLRICNDRKSAKLDNDDPDHSSCAIYGFDGKWWVIIYLTNDSLRTACHESVHGAMSLLDVLGVKPSFDDQEPVAWLTDYIFSRCQCFFESIKS
ncbi:hypothetical protein ORI99_00105 [Alishewanella sp. SMS9]|nr:hypothetical protein [Alishewanella sp. SMS9]